MLIGYRQRHPQGERKKIRCLDVRISLVFVLNLPRPHLTSLIPTQPHSTSLNLTQPHSFSLCVPGLFPGLSGWPTAGVLRHDAGMPRWQRPGPEDHRTQPRPGGAPSSAGGSTIRYRHTPEHPLFPISSASDRAEIGNTGSAMYLYCGTAHPRAPLPLPHGICQTLSSANQPVAGHQPLPWSLDTSPPTALPRPSRCPPTALPLPSHAPRCPPTALPLPICGLLKLPSITPRALCHSAHLPHPMPTHSPPHRPAVTVADKRPAETPPLNQTSSRTFICYRFLSSAGL